MNADSNNATAPTVPMSYDDNKASSEDNLYTEIQKKYEKIGELTINYAKKKNEYKSMIANYQTYKDNSYELNRMRLERTHKELANLDQFSIESYNVLVKTSLFKALEHVVKTNKQIRQIINSS